MLPLLLTIAQLLPLASVCRPAVGPCDVAEVDTDDGEPCPPDAYVEDGTPCETGDFCITGATCTGGICGTGASVLEIEPTTVNFGVAPVGGSISTHVHLRYTGSLALRVGSTHEDFMLSAGADTVLDGMASRADLPLTFAPTRSSKEHGLITVSANGCERAIAVNGSGVGQGDDLTEALDATDNALNDGGQGGCSAAGAAPVSLVALLALRVARERSRRD